MWKEKIETLMCNNKMYENPQLVISDISSKLGTHSKKVSQVINQGFNMNFNDFINHYRITYFLQKIQGGEHNIQTFLSIAFECGFNSKSTFNRAFKRATSLNPKEYIENITKISVKSGFKATCEFKNIIFVISKSKFQKNENITSELSSYCKLYFKWSNANRFNTKTNRTS